MMQPKTVRYLNLILFGGLSSLAAFTMVSWLAIEPLQIDPPLPPKPPKLIFSFKPKEKSDFGAPFMRLGKNELRMRLPDLRNILVYYGSNQRPDVAQFDSLVSLGIRGSPQSTPVSTKGPVYLAYQNKPGLMRWSFSPNNAPTSTWIEITPEVGKAKISVFMKQQNGQLVKEPDELATFMIGLQHLPTNIRPTEAWEIGGIRVDNSFLMRQRAVWFGQDLFLQQYGGASFSTVKEKERIDFVDANGTYNCFVDASDCLVYTDGRWQVAEAGPETRMKPLLTVKKIDERSISFDLWESEGKNKISLELRKVMSPIPLNIPIDIKLLGARSKTEWIIEMSGTRTFVSDDDWLILSAGKWTKISTPEELDDYVFGRIRGKLLVLDGTEKNGNDVSLLGILFDESRTRQAPIKISMFKSWEKGQKNTKPAVKKPVEQDDDDDDDEDDDDDFDDDDDEDFDFEDDDDDDED
jgi:hypothetical protein